ncbi:hypothetical protein BVG19_g1941 [[Candida] boidinii]|nr:hypothetical protein BVG19_g1941 [[Candida] boidinii]OWB51610.1 hypothetical protein B5S27_g3175 [[Candida] boidinii]OWB83717.1 hypothetical protein B5S33_g2348 [[Candida] boidinii]
MSNSIKDTRTLRVVPPIPMSIEEMNQERQKRENKNTVRSKDTPNSFPQSTSTTTDTTATRPSLGSDNGSKRKSYIESLMSNVNTSKYTTAVSSGQTLSPTISSPQNRIHTINDSFNSNKQDPNMIPNSTFNSNSNSNSQVALGSNTNANVNSGSGSGIPSTSNNSNNNQQWIKKIRGLPSTETINENRILFNKIGDKDEKVYSNIRNTVKLDLERVDYLSKNLTISNDLIIRNLKNAVESSNWLDE